ncbi:MAG: EF2563 family selenium-dependent molybdenum hydroxylase system protein [bacterium]|nr:EF2563 family selenium-dependent molybdenum hydroxylase system protein [bacterium]
MLFGDELVVVRGGGDLASGAAYTLHQAGFPVVVCELAQPLAIRRAVSFASVVAEGEIIIDGIRGVRSGSVADARSAAVDGAVAVMVSADLPLLNQSVVVDARLAKRNLDTTVDQAPLVVALGPGFNASVDCDAVVETMRGHALGRVIWDGPAAADTGVPGDVGGATAQRVLRSPGAGTVTWSVAIGDLVESGQRLGVVGTEPVESRIAGVVRGLILDGFPATEGLKIADVDPRAERSACFEISDKARLVGAGVLEAILVWLNRR